MPQFLEKLATLAGQLVAPGSQFSLEAVACAFALAFAFLLLRHWRARGRFRPDVVARAIARRRLLFTPSSCADMGYFVVNTMALGGLVGWGVFSSGVVAAHARAALTGLFGARAPVDAPELFVRGGATLLFFLAYELGYWIDHWLKHRVRFLWELHKTHHTAEALTPLSVFRMHPLDTLIFADIVAAVTGLVEGGAAYALGRAPSVYTLDGTNVILLFFLYAYVHLQHTEFWIPITGRAGRVFMSPAHHQIHHSTDPAHYNTNLGSCLSLFDWLFGTLRVPNRKPQRLSFGAAVESGDPHSVTELFLSPVFNALGLKPPATGKAPRAEAR
jgi:sterol desaturase/sphingolipid hydroxylase (fatty acid hydroxylase superfamily)